MSICNLTRSLLSHQMFMNKMSYRHENVKNLSLFQNPQRHLFSNVNSNGIERLKQKSDNQFQLGLGLIGTGLWVTAVTDFFLSPVLVDLAATEGGAKVFLVGACNPMALYFFGCAVKEFSASNQTQSVIREMEKKKEESSTASDDPASLILMHAAIQSSHEEPDQNFIHSACKAEVQEGPYNDGSGIEIELDSDDDGD